MVNNLCALSLTHLHVWRDSFTCVTWLVHMCDMTPSQVWRMTWAIHVWRDVDVTYSHVWHDSFTCATCLIHMAYRCSWPSLSRTIHMPSPCHVSHVTYMNERCHIHTWLMSHSCMSHVTHIHIMPVRSICPRPAMWVTSQRYMSHVTYIHE